MAWREVVAILVEEVGAERPLETAGVHSAELGLAWYAPAELDDLT